MNAPGHGHTDGKKSDVLDAARSAAIQGSKRAADLIHRATRFLTRVTVEFALNEGASAIDCEKCRRRRCADRRGNGGSRGGFGGFPGDLRHLQGGGSRDADRRDKIIGEGGWKIWTMGARTSWDSPPTLIDRDEADQQ